MTFFSKNLKFLREYKKLSQNKLAEAVGINQTTIARWENNEISPSLDNLLDLAKTLQISLSELTGRDLSLKTDFKENNEVEVLFNKFKDLSKDDKELIKNIIETREKQVDKQLGEIDY